MLSYEPGTTMLHRLDPRVKLAGQVAFGVAAFAYTSLPGVLGLSALALAVLAAGRLGPIDALRTFGPLVPFLIAAPLVAGLTLGPPWFSVTAAIPPALASYRSILLLAVGAAYVETTPVRESRAAIQWLVPGSLGRSLGLGVGFVFRLLPRLQGDLVRTRRASRARLGSERTVPERIRLVGLAGLDRAGERADGLARGLQARALSWNPTPPRLRFRRADYLGLAIVGAIFAAGVVGFAF